MPGIELVTQLAKRPARQKIPNPGQNRAAHRSTQHVKNQFGAAFAGFQGDIPGESIGNDHIGLIPAEIRAFDKTDKLHIIR